MPYITLGVRPAARRKEPPSGHFDVSHHQDALIGAIHAIIGLFHSHRSKSQPLRAKDIDRVLRLYPRGGEGFFSRSQLIAGFRQLAPHVNFGITEDEFVTRMRMRPVRTVSGVSPITVFTKPFACPGHCVFCPNDLRMPKSYLRDEPGAQRAEDNSFDPYLQTWGRLNVFRSIGHSTSKVELIVLGGTWSHYPEGYRRWFVTRCFDAMNDFAQGIDARKQCSLPQKLYQVALEKVAEDGDAIHSYNEFVTRVLRTINHGKVVSGSEMADWDALFEAHRINESSSCRCVGLTVETRPDEINESELICLRRLGCTKVQFGIQSLDDEVLRQNKRGHDSHVTRRASQLLRSAGFKIHAHWMPNLLGSTPKRDCRDFDRLFDDQALRPDELKIYPCSLIETAELMNYYLQKQWHPYTKNELIDVLSYAMTQTPRYCRLTRVVRDIPSGDIVAGNRTSNLREVVNSKLMQVGKSSVDIRAREVRHRSVTPEQLAFRVTSYSAGSGEEHFLEWIGPKDTVVAFLRLFLPVKPSFIPEIARSALIRELHVYGSALKFALRESGIPQHQGLGRKLIDKAKEIANDQGYHDLAVISAVGTRNYYRQLGFNDGSLYQHFGLSE